MSTAWGSHIQDSVKDSVKGSVKESVKASAQDSDLAKALHRGGG